MSLYVSGIRLPFEEPQESAIAAALSTCGLHDAPTASVWRVSIDARRGNIMRVYTVRIDGIENDEAFAEKLQMPVVRYQSNAALETPVFGQAKLAHRPVVAGFGPAGLFAAFTLAQYGYQPIVLERGQCMQARDAAVEKFWTQGAFETASNIQFGEGGAGAYSDGKLTTRIGDARCQTVLNTFVEFGAPDEILKQARPHIGTDRLKGVVQRMREEIIRLGGSVQFETQVLGVQYECGTLRAVRTNDGEIPTQSLVLAIGHSARDTFLSLHADGVMMKPKAFSVGARIEHLQRDVDKMLYGKHAGHPLLPPAEYTLSHRKDGRACYSFCMCPGGLVVAAQSEEHTVVTNGMSFHARSGKNANAAIAVSVSPEDFADGTPFGGIALQRTIERAAYAQTDGYEAPCQRVTDFLQDQRTKRLGTVLPSYPVGVKLGRIDACLPKYVTKMMRETLPIFGRKMHGFDGGDAVLTAPETRTSSPVRIVRGDDYHSRSLKGLIPCGEGAGYAGGIVSAAVDGVRAAEHIMCEWQPLG